MEIVFARRSAAGTATNPLGTSTWTAAGLRYERSARKSLANNSQCLVSHNPVFYYETNTGAAPMGRYCIPDFILAGLPFLGPGGVAILECKLTHKWEAREKLLDLYAPVVRKALHTEEIFPVMVVKNLTPEAPEPQFTLEAAWNRMKQTQAMTRSPRFVPVVQWLGKGSFPIVG